MIRLLSRKELGEANDVNGELSEEFLSGKGLWQGDALVFLLFNLVLEKAIREPGLQVNGNIFTRLVQLFTYVDDIDIVGRFFQAVLVGFLEFTGPGRRLGLEINEAKTKYRAIKEAPRLI